MNEPGRSDPDIAAIAAEVLAALDGRCQIEPFSRRIAAFDLARAYAVCAEVARRRRARNETPIGRKIGFTNRGIWDTYGVRAPIWGYVYDSTLHAFAAGGTFSLRAFSEPLIEPEIVFKLAGAPQAGMDDAAILDCVEWVAHGFEIVQSIFPGWKFAAADTVAACGLHGALLLGEPHCLRADERSDWLRRLASFEIRLHCAGIEVDRGRAASVLDGPLSTVRHLVQLLDSDRDNPPLAAGEIITTGTLTRAWPVKPGEAWASALSGLPLPGLSVRFV